MMTRALRWTLFILMGVIIFLDAIEAIESNSRQVTPRSILSTPKSNDKETIALVVDGLPRGGGWMVPSGWNPWGYKLTSLGEEFLSYGGSNDGDIGRFLASVKTRKRLSEIKNNWLEVVRVAKTGQSMRIYKNLTAIIEFCLKAGLID